MRCRDVEFLMPLSDVRGSNFFVKGSRGIFLESSLYSPLFLDWGVDDSELFRSLDTNLNFEGRSCCLYLLEILNLLLPK
jgi:hypothetical protein